MSTLVSTSMAEADFGKSKLRRLSSMFIALPLDCWVIDWILIEETMQCCAGMSVFYEMLLALRASRFRAR